MLFSCGNDQEEDRWMQGPTAEAIDIPEIEWVPLAVVYLQENMILDNLSGNFNSRNHKIVCPLNEERMMISY